LQALADAGLTVKLGKCQRGKCHPDYLGDRIGCRQLCVPGQRVEAMKKFKIPVTRKDLLAFLGSVGYLPSF